MTTKSQKPTSFDVAKKAGVDRSIVSRALSGTGRMSDETRNKVIKAAEELGYRVNFLARGLQNRSSGLIGLVASGLETPYRSQQVRHAAAGILREGYTPILIVAEGSDDIGGLLSRLLNYNVSGMIVTSDTPPEKIIEDCESQRVPVALINRDVTKSNADRVQLDLHDSGQLAFDMLHTGGAQHFAAIIPERQSYSVNGRAEGFVAACQAAGCEVELIRVPRTSYENGLAAADELLAHHKYVSAVFATTDLLALGVLDRLRVTHGVSVPDQMQIVGFDDIPQASWLSNALSTIRQDAQVASDLAIELILERIKDPDKAFEVKTIPIEPVHRATTRNLG